VIILDDLEKDGGVLSVAEKRRVLESWCKWVPSIVRSGGRIGGRFVDVDDHSLLEVITDE